GAPSEQPLVRVKETTDILSGFERTEEEDIAVCCNVRLSRTPLRCTRGTDSNAVDRHLEHPFHLGGGESGRYDNPVGAVCVTARQDWIIASNLGASSFGVSKKVQVVDRDHVSRATGRKQQRMQGMRDVEGLSGQSLGQGPTEAMPSQVQHP